MCFYMFIRPFMDIPFVFFCWSRILWIENQTSKHEQVLIVFFFWGEVHKKKISKNTFKMLEERKELFYKDSYGEFITIILARF